MKEKGNRMESTVGRRERRRRRRRRRRQEKRLLLGRVCEGKGNGGGWLNDEVGRKARLVVER